MSSVLCNKVGGTELLSKTSTPVFFGSDDTSVLLFADLGGSEILSEAPVFFWRDDTADDMGGSEIASEEPVFFRRDDTVVSLFLLVRCDDVGGSAALASFLSPFFRR